MDAERFILEFPEGADKIDVGHDWTLGDVVRGDHEGGLAATAPVIGGNAATVAAKTRQRDARRKKLSSTLLQYILDKALQSKLRGGGNGEQQWALYKRASRQQHATGSSGSCTCASATTA